MYYIQPQSIELKTMNLLFMSIAIAVIVSGIIWGIFRIAMWMQGREEKQLKGK